MYNDGYDDRLQLVEDCWHLKLITTTAVQVWCIDVFHILLVHTKFTEDKIFQFAQSANMSQQYTINYNYNYANTCVTKLHVPVTIQILHLIRL